MLHPNRNIAFSTYPFGSHVAALVMARQPRHIMAERGKNFGGGCCFGMNTHEKEAEVGDDIFTGEFWVHSAQFEHIIYGKVMDYDEFGYATYKAMEESRIRPSDLPKWHATVGRAKLNNHWMDLYEKDKK